MPPYFESGDGAVPQLYQVFQDMGYRIHLVNHMDFLDTDGTRVLTHGQHADSIGVYLYQNSLLPSVPVLSGLVEQLPQLQTKTAYEDMLQESLGLMESAWRYAEDGPTLTLGYVQCPHTYFPVRCGWKSGSGGAWKRLGGPAVLSGLSPICQQSDPVGGG